MEMDEVKVEFMFLGSENYHIDVCSTSKEMNIFQRNTFQPNSQDIGLYSTSHTHSRNNAHDN